MSWTLGKAEEKDSNRINELFIEILQHLGYISGLDMKYMKTREVGT